MVWPGGARTLVGALALACASAPAARPRPFLPVPLISQSTSYSCGAAALMSVLLYFQVFDGPEAELHAPLAVTPEQGTHPDRIVKVAQRFGLQADKRDGLDLEDLRQELGSGALVILDIQAWPDGSRRRWQDHWEDGHYVVLVGMDDRNVYVMDPSVRGRYGYIPQPELLQRWHDYEREAGRRRIYDRLGIVVRGAEPLEAYPGPPVRIR